MLEPFENRRVLLLQGPAGPFFRRFAAQLRQRGARVTKVNFNAGDDLFYRGSEVRHYRGTFDRWRAFVTDLLRREAINVVVLFGDWRRYHRVAIEQARALGVEVYVFEEGYLRPDFVTLERGGVNGCSSLPRDPAFYRRLTPTDLPKPRPVGRTMPQAAWYATAYAVTHGLLSWRYPHYEHHRSIRPFEQAGQWLRGASRRVKRMKTDRAIDEAIAAGSLPPFFLVPLQVHLDAQMLHCPFASVDAFIEQVVQSFARHAPADTVLMLKHHPLDRGYRDYGDLLNRLDQAHQLRGRLRYVDAINLPAALRAARGTVVINSTVGLSSIHHGTPVKCLGTAVYDMAGLTFQGQLDGFWRDPGQVDGPLYNRFRWWLRTHNQINGSVWTRLHL